MTRIHGILLAFAVAAGIAAPAAAQFRFSDSTAILKAVRENDGATVEQILANPSSGAANARDPESGEGALHIIVRRRDLNWLAYMLGKGSRPDLQSNDGMTPLALAAALGWTDGAQQLLARNANVNLANNRGETPLILAVHARQAAIIPLLLAQGADPNHSDSVAGYSALDYARQDSRDPTIARLLEAAPARQQRPQQVFGPSR